MWTAVETRPVIPVAWNVEGPARVPGQLDTTLAARLFRAGSLETLGRVLARHGGTAVKSARACALLAVDPEGTTIEAIGAAPSLPEWKRISLDADHPGAIAVRSAVAVLRPRFPGKRSRGERARTKETGLARDSARDAAKTETPVVFTEWVAFLPLTLGRRRAGCLALVIERNDAEVRAEVQQLCALVDFALAHLRDLVRERKRAKRQIARSRRRAALGEIALAATTGPARVSCARIAKAVAAALDGGCAVAVDGVGVHEALLVVGGARGGRGVGAGVTSEPSIWGGESIFAEGILKDLRQRLPISVRGALNMVGGRGGVALLAIRDHGRPCGALLVVRRGAGFSREERAFLERATAQLEDLLRVRRATSPCSELDVNTAMREEFLAMAGHEIGGPLATATMLTGAIEESLRRSGVTVSEATQTLFDSTRGQLERLAVLIRQISEAARRSLSSADPRREEIDFGELVCDTLDTLRVTDTRMEQVRLRVAGRPVRGRWDPGQLRQVISNLVLNALKFGEERPITVLVRLHPGEVELRVKDRGIGIAPADQERIFERFVRAVPGRQYAGFGLGLWLVRQIVGAHGGTIDVESELGKGSTFVVSLPTTGMPAVAPAPRRSVSARPGLYAESSARRNAGLTY